MRIISAAEVVALCQRLAEGIDGYLVMLERGVSSPDADACVDTLLGLQVNSLAEDAAATVYARIDALENATAAAADSVSAIAVGSIATVSADGESGYFPALGSLDGGSVAAWLSFDSVLGDQVRLRRLGVAADEPATLTSLHPTIGDELEPGQVVVRPTFASSPVGETPVRAQWLLYSVPSELGWDVTARRVTGSGVDPACVVSPGADHAVNQEAVVDERGDLHVVNQERYGGDFRAVFRSLAGSDLSEPVLLSAAGQSAWDPCVAVDTHGSTSAMVAVWSTYREGRFRLVMRRCVGGEWHPEVMIPTDHERHALHPQMATDPAGGVWLTWDSLAIPDLATSGLTRYQRASEVGRNPTHDPVPGFASACRVDLVHISAGFHGETFATVAAPDTIAMRSAACYPRVAVDGTGRLWVAYRAMRQLPFGDYLAHMAVRYHDGDRWSLERILPASDGTCAEFAMLPEQRGVQVLYHTDGHAARHLHMCRSHPAPEVADTEEARRREHLRMPATDRMAAGGHVGGGAVTLAAVDAQSRTVPPTLIDVPSMWSNDAAGANVQPRQHTPDGWPPDDGVTRQLYWGDLHRHSNVSRCGAGLDIDAEDHYRYAEDLLGSDFWALTDHSENTSDLNWHHLKKLANTFYRPGAHTSLIGFEWTSFIYGHMNVIYSGNDAPIFSSIDEATHDPAGLWAQLEPFEALTIPHHPASWVYPTDWTYRSERFLRLVEVFQACTGSYESLWAHRQYHDSLAPKSTVTAALQAGHRVGLIGSTDHGNGVAYVGLYAESLDRRSVFQALSDRRCFAATRRGIVPELRIGSASMGQETSFAEASAMPIRIAALGINELSVIQLVRDGDVVATITEPSGANPGWVSVPLDVQSVSLEGGPRELVGSVSVSGGARLVPTAFYPPEVTSFDDAGLTWSSALPPWYGKRRSPPAIVNIGVSIEGPADAVVTIEANGVRQQLRLGELTDARVWTASTDLLELHARRGTGGLTGMGVTKWQGEVATDLLLPGSWYYVRVIQIDGETAWSSPIWVDE